MNGFRRGNGWSVRAGVCVLFLAVVLGTVTASVFGAAEGAASAAVAASGPLAAGQEYGSGAGVKRAAQVSRSEQADVTFELRPLENGAVQVVGRRGRLEVTKNIQPTGEFELELSSDRDRVTIAVSSAVTKITRGKTTVALRPGTSDEDEEVKVRRVLAESKAVTQFRAVAAALVDTDDSSPGAMAFVIADAVVGSLTGDVGAPRRTAQHLGRKARRNVRPVGMAADCFAVMEQKMMFASNDFNECWVGTLFNSFYQTLCSYRWVIQVESYWFSFISCSGFNWR